MSTLDTASVPVVRAPAIRRPGAGAAADHADVPAGDEGRDSAHAYRAARLAAVERERARAQLDAVRLMRIL
jgi:hypothetical protein